MFVLDPLLKSPQLVAYEGGGTLRLEIEQTDDTQVRVLEYDRSIAELGVWTDPSGALELLPVDSSPDEALPLPTPTRVSELRGLGRELVQISAQDPWLDAVRVRRPPCGRAPEYEPIRTEHPDRTVSLAVSLGGHVIVGVAADPGPRLYRAHATTHEVEELSGRPGLPRRIGRSSG